MFPPGDEGISAMMVCSCNCITDHAIRATVDRLMLDRPLHLLTPVAVYKALGKRPCCGGCLPNAQQIVQCRVACLRGECRPATCSCTAAARLQVELAVATTTTVETTRLDVCVGPGTGGTPMVQLTVEQIAVQHVAVDHREHVCEHPARVDAAPGP
jgi:bacterioferritin-associated ferredoxin